MALINHSVTLDRHYTKEHVGYHGDILECIFCKNFYSDRNRFEDHIATHTSERPYFCVQCPNSFSNISSLRSHMRWHANFPQGIPMKPKKQKSKSLSRVWNASHHFPKQVNSRLIKSAATKMK